MFKIIISAIILIVMAVTNPDKGDFDIYLINHINENYNDTKIKKDKVNITTFVKVLGNLAFNAIIQNATIQKDYFLFSIFTIDMTLLRAIDSNQKNIKIIGILGTFYKIN